jgi:DNA repair protein RecO (recombination protein O)
VPPVHDDAICIRQWDWSETSQTVSLFCRSLGLVRGLAKGARRPKAPFSGGIEVLTRGHAGVIVKQSTDMALLTEWDLLEQFPALRRSLDAHYAGLYMAELVHYAVHDHDPHTALYDALLDALRSLDDELPRRTALVNFQWAILVETGYRPEVGCDVRTGAELPQAAAFRFSPALGGLMPDKVSAAESAGTWRVRRETAEILGRLPLPSPAPSPAPGPAPAAPKRESIDRAGRLLAVYLRYVLGREPRMLPYLYDRQLPR